MRYGVIEAQSMPISFASSQQTQFLLTAGGVTIERPSHTAIFDRDGHLERTTEIEPGTVVATNVVWSPLIRFRGAELLGRDEIGRAVVAVRAPDPDAISVTTRRPPPVLAGAIVSLIGLAAAAWWLIADAGAGGRAWVSRLRVRPAAGPSSRPHEQESICQ